MDSPEPVPHETARPETPVSEADRPDAQRKELNKENDGVVAEPKPETPTRTRPIKPKTQTPDTAAKTPESSRKSAAAHPGSAPSKIAKPNQSAVHRDSAPADVDTPREAKADEKVMGDLMEATWLRSTRDETRTDDRSQRPVADLIMNSPADTQEDLAGLGEPKTNGFALDSREIDEDKTVVGSVSGDGKFPGYDEYPLLSIDENDRESRARERAYYRGYGVRFAPWNIPFKRRLQTMAVLMHSLSIASTVSLFFFLCAIPLTWPIIIPYLLHMLLSKAATDGRLRFRSERFRRLPVWKFFADYYPARLHKTHDLPPTRKYIFGYHPHGIISHGAFAAFATESLGFSEKFPGITNSLLTLDSNFRIPLYREYILSLGIQSVSKDSITNILTKGGRNDEGMGRAVTIVVGGARESLEAQPYTMHLVLSQRKGFIKLAVRTGADLVPVLAFGENDLYDQVSPETHPGIRRMQMFILNTLKFTLPFLHGRGIFNYDVGLMPYRRPLNIVVGKPIYVAQARDGDVDMAEVDRLHGLYVDELKKMWDRYKDEFAADRKEEMTIMA
ncbi:diacylglycerol acyltransferase-domain-containing protein [Cercophora newfieldiana]|uniref:diacylglycerol O-acyltransferase n=1 Tax=Cercophora newfieldiana TaxID=92897 RepID=A0AA40CZD9_9PEZI|nr:diacylglycerol acyltransferase-domain-containing protein [Cercophora newfieldiana]